MARGGKSKGNYQFDIPFEAISFDRVATDEQLRSHGVTLVHYAMTFCVENAATVDDTRNHINHQCSGGMKFEKVGEVEGLFTSNSTSSQWADYGLQDGSSSLITVPRYYDVRYDGGNCDCPIIIQTLDRFYIKDESVRVSNAQRFEHSQTLVDRMAYPVLSVQSLEDSRGNKYREGIDFDTKDGFIYWRSGHSPGYDTTIDKGVVCSIRYEYLPFYSVRRIPHEIRVSKSLDPITGETKLSRSPMQLLVDREWVFHDEDRDEREKPSDRDVPSPRRGSFGPR